ncbi:MAG: molybdate ABC transporter ATP-binding protein ModF [Gammaproteobacteria bacterium]|nr:molybdate ABC transporter ATP-binding protein ModF [Gammaproteobacteria bacterium]
MRATLRFSETFSLIDIKWRIEPGEIWAITGANGSGKSALAAALAGVGELTAGSIHGFPSNVGVVSLEAQAELIERERDRDDSDFTDKISEGTPVAEMLDELSVNPGLLARLIEIFRFAPLMERGFRKLSTGETRKILITRALTCNPEMLVLDGPFEGLDAETVPLVRKILRQQSFETAMVLVFNRFDEIPEFVTNIAYLENGTIKHKVETSDIVAVEDLSQLLHLKKADVEIPKADLNDKVPVLDDSTPLVRIRNASIRYGDNTVFKDLDWCIEPQQHWQLTGPNGSGKTCLLNLITGDHPQCYSNDIFVFGFQRGSGESIWDIKQYIGYVSTALQWEYRVSINLANVIISGFYDSIGLYNKASDTEKQIALQWLQLLGLESQADQPFNRLSYGDQRLLLIARAMVKHPPLLILDEPCLGLDDINRQMVLALIEKICAGSETTVLYVNHHAEDKIEGIEQHLSLG